MWYMNNIIITYWVYIVYGPSFPNLFTIVFRGRGWLVYSKECPHEPTCNWDVLGSCASSRLLHIASLDAKGCPK